ncbi:hypothetical protein Aes012_125 [Aeromonas phage Aes012]|jgi:hypothetical protein|uniref:Uncharacterized protein n=1 Tax=Aeromonas phage Aes012 TaxID=1198014 RepID=I6ZVB7_9CAUD|nr:hypothetical protein Aes012_125 [Aeromonas phage Aes012]UYD57421.1 hypothetical protein OFDDKENP_00027 [Aeromonas phage B614]UYD58230.1 hypothetical protein JNEOFJEA_00151 [Aeromonas phage UP87]UYD58344.1 hypothetical protein IPAKJDPM_00001 [Aeromonas phage avDM14-QBC]UYD58808.1 hypothetical protein HNNIDBEH_00232 [Aeromonas phage avDM10-HWA]UYD58889.1 hypothetical protein OFOPOMKI_00022 [Aeromonas phage avDM7-IJDJ]UYD59949.1 hypothetical protein LEHPIFIF_00176 [Aeromonas phage avDM9-HANS]
MENIDLTAENEAELDFNNFSIHELAQQLEDTNTKYHLARIIAKALLSRRLNEYDLEK